mgnify:CR=1 FL=1
MAYSEEIFARASAALSDRRRRAQLEADAHKAEVYAALPEVADLDRAIFSTAVSLSKLVLSGGLDFQSSFSELQEHNIDLQNRRAALLENADYPADYTEPKYVCGKCRDTGRVGGVICSCYRELCRQEARRAIDACTGSSTCSFADFSLAMYPEACPQPGVKPRKKMEEILNFCKGYADDFSASSPSILMMGKTGLGKTHLSLSIAKVVTDRGFGVMYGPAQRLFDKLEKERFGRGGECDGAMRSMSECDLLIMDDLGAEFSTSFTNAALGDIVNTRLLEKRPVIISTNLAPAEIVSRYSERTASRMFGEYRTLMFFGEDIRLKRQSGRANEENEGGTV